MSNQERRGRKGIKKWEKKEKNEIEKKQNCIKL